MALFVQDGYRYLASQPPAGPLFKIEDYDFDRDPPRLAYAASFINAATFNPDNGAIEFDEVKAFRQAGGKLGWADALVPPRFTVDFYEALARKSGGVAMTQDFARLFMAGQRVEVNIAAARESPAGIEGPRRRAFAVF
jgi:hypothetical protein